MAMKIAFLWHMHQPYYKNLADNSYLLPWVRLHALKDYYGMVALLREFPKIRQNFNLVPSLLIQLQDYADENARETMLELSLKPAADLEDSDKSYLLRYFFYANKDHVIARFPRYLELLEKRGLQGTVHDMEKARARYTLQDYIDLQVIQKLAWMDEEYLESDPAIVRLVEKGKHFEESDKQILRSKELELIRRIIPEYKEAAERGQIELSTSPFYHPILPLLVSPRIAKESNPHAQIPISELLKPEDAREQIQRAISFHEKTFGQKPVGCWPSEGSVSEQILPLLVEAGFQWTATDEEILLHSIEKGPVPEKAKWCANNLYVPYERSLADENRIRIVFRDHVLSDLIGFSYSRISVDDAAEDFMKRLHDIHDRIQADNPSGPPMLVSIILDGENAWEYYPNNGREFLRRLYTKLSNDPVIETTTISEYITEFPSRPLVRIFPGSWIDHNFNIWIGHPEDNKAWTFLKEARDLVDYSIVNEPHKSDLIQKAFEEILIAEGSDWFWWFGDDHSSENDPEFDRLFRQHISNVYHYLGKPVPEALLMPIKAPRAAPPAYRVPRRFVSPMMDGEISNYFEWLTAGHYSALDVQGTMHRAEPILKQILFGFDLNHTFFRIDARKGKISELMAQGFEFQVLILPWFILSVKRKEDASIQVVLERERDDTWILLEHHCEAAAGTVLELKLPFADLEAGSGDNIRFRLTLSQHDVVFEEHPQSGSIQFQVPGPHFEEMDWEV